MVALDGPEPERGIWVPDQADRADLLTYAQRALRTDPAAVIRLRSRSPDVTVVWVATGFDVLASRVIRGRLRPADLCCGAEVLTAAIPKSDDAGFIAPGFSMDSGWRGALPPAHGFTHLDDVPARSMLDLARRGVDLTREQAGAHGPPSSLLDQDVVSVSSGDLHAKVPMRCVFALVAMGFLPQMNSGEPGSLSTSGDGFSSVSVPEDEVVRVRVAPTWLRIDARFGSVYRRRGDSALMLD